MTQHFDVVVVGSGPAGLNAAYTAARDGATVALLDDNPRAGGQIWRQGPGHPGAAPLVTLLAALRQQRTVTHWTSTRVIAPLQPRGLLLESAEHGGVRISYGRLILATGARERLLPFDGWTLPGVSGAGALQALIKGGMPVRGERIVIAGSGPLLIAALATARAAGARVVAVVEQARAVDVARFGATLLAEPAKLRQAIGMTRGFAGLTYLTGSMVTQARGDGRVERVTIRRGIVHGHDRGHAQGHEQGHDGRETTFACDRLACGYGLVPNIALAMALGCQIGEAGGIVVDDKQRTSVQSVLAAGECTGIGGAELAAVEGEIAGWMAGAAAHASGLAALQTRRARWRRFAQRVERAFALQDAVRTPPVDATLLCRCEDVTVGEVRVCADWREAKLHTRCGMGACQGRICGTAAGLYFGWSSAASRPPFNPARIDTLMTPAIEPPSSD